MNCYYSNFIEGHNTHPYDIERALKKDFSTNNEQRNLQLEAKAHIDLQKKIDDDDTLENMKKYYGIEDHTDLLKFIKLNGINNPDHYDSYDDELI